ncbi:protein NRT1/ PTR FAMILY 2.11-like isoform X2 [Oryza brachyantha]|uniref:protein NRT1/ PTR FAMILY 2.11-like isoform X2 n=1 Tax=Oryza brachyantha TaxID=4533 RepID=UPI001ADBB742|nr:protein NRT1/ PTR FAMILY 2.11-like isoform X2 [Oryza brachyantha]
MEWNSGNETCERLGTIGTTANLLVYLTTVFHIPSVRAATLLNVFSGTTNLAPLLGAFLCDAYLGRYATLAAASFTSFLGMLLLTLTAALRSLHPPSCTSSSCQGPTHSQLAALLASFAFLVLGAGGIRPCNLAFGADQFDPGTAAGRRGIASFFNWYYFTFTIAMMVSATLIIYLQSNINWAIGLAVPTALMGLSCVLFFMGTRLYVRVRPDGSPFTSFAQVLVAATRKRRLPAPAPADDLFDPPHRSKLVAKLAYTDQFRWLDKAAAVTAEDTVVVGPDGSAAAANPWRLCTVQQVEEVKVLARIVPVWSTSIVYFVVLTQLGTYTVFQVMQSDRRVGRSGFEVPPGSMVVFNMLALTAWLPVYDRVVVPALRRVTGREDGISQLQRIGLGLALSVATMAMAAAVERRRRGVGSGSSWAWMVPQQAMAGLSEAFAAIGLNELCYKDSPESMRSVAGALSPLGLAVASYASGAMVTAVQSGTGWLAQDLNKGRVDLFYLVVGAMAAANLGYFVACAFWYRSKRTDGGGGELEMEFDGGAPAMA